MKVKPRGVTSGEYQVLFFLSIHSEHKIIIMHIMFSVGFVLHYFCRDILPIFVYDVSLASLLWISDLCRHRPHAR